MTAKGEILVTCSTGTQGGAVADVLLDAGWPVRLVMRDSKAPEAIAFAALGARIFTGSLEDADSLHRAAEGVYGVFSVPVVGGPEAMGLELLGARNLIAAAKAGGVRHFIHSSVAAAGRHTQFTQWDKGMWWPEYWLDKAAYENMVREAGFAHHTVVKPAYMIENFIPPKALYMVPHLAQGRLATAFAPDTRLDVIAAKDIGRFVLAALCDPVRFDRATIELAQSSVTMAELAAIISATTGKPIEVVHFTPDEARAAGIMEMVIDNHQWNNSDGYQVDIEALSAWGIELTTLEDWADDNREKFLVG